MVLDDDGTDTDGPPPPRACQVCGKEGGKNNDRNGGHSDENNGEEQRRRRLLRCTQCENAWYCSVDCQRLDWERGGHRQLCRRSRRSLRRSKKSNVAASASASAAAAAVELVRLVSSLSVDQATESYHKSLDEIITKKQLQQRMNMLIKKKKRDDDDEAAASKNHNRVVSLQKNTTTTTTTTTQKEPKTLGIDLTNASGSTATAVAASSSSSSSPSRHHPLVPPPCWDFYVEDLTRLSCYQIVILLNDVDLSSLPSLSSKSDITTNNKTNNVFLHDNLDIAITLARPYHRRGEDVDDDDDDASYVVRIAMQQQEQQEKETTAISKDNNNSPTIPSGKMILQLALPAGIVILPNNTYNNNMQDDDNNMNQMTIPYTMDTSMNGRQGLVSIRLRYTTTNKHAIMLQQQQQNQQSLQSPISQLLQESPPLEVPSWSLRENEQLLTPNEANRLACRACGHFLFSLDDSLHDENNASLSENNNGNRKDYDKSSNSNNNVDDSTNSRINCKQKTTRRRMMMMIQRVLPMPSGRWEDMADYLTCYEGQAVVDFSSSNISVVATGVKGSAGKNLNNNVNNNMTLLQDETTLVLSHVVDKGDDDFEKNNERDDNDDSHSHVLSFPSVCRLSIPGYGQVQQASTSSPIASWRNSLGVGGNNNNNACLALACNLCCSVVGEAQEEEEEETDEKPEQDEFSQQSCFTYRFWKHRLVVIPKEEDEKEKKLPLLTKRTTATSRKILSSTLAFMVQELIRLAETKAIYTLSIFCDKGMMMEKSSNNDDTHKKPQSPKVMVLRLVSWGDSSTCAAMAVMGAGASAIFKDTTHNTARNNDPETIVYPLKTWRPMAKVLYEIRNVSDKPDEMFPYPQEGPVASKKNIDNDVWSMLNQNDWCCPLPSSGQTRWQGQRSATGEEEKKESMSNVNKDSNEQQSGPPPPPQQRQRQVILESWEWHQVLDDLKESSRVYGKQVVSATFFAKTGREFFINDDNNGDNNDNNDNVVVPQIGLAAVLL